ncbi:hypothetical protein CDD81_2248 [Ophiocordyceps australis]|uniref:Molybdopterin synthase sulfur carrier subunit n=1 Tax=Ophiocordyceps australis TaxID=1399860 RepID=A0A2C5XK58_9HYPO|nr:hypothetical protein CDD81_2248 [Ophiocordyceps australis]
MALNRKYANLPDLDSAPDIYETPDLTDDNSTIPTTNQAPSEDDFFDAEQDDEAQGISRSRLRIDEARSRFTPANIDATGVDFSDRVDGKRKSYKTTSRRQRILQDGTEELGDVSEGDDDEGLQRRIARLTREVEEAKADFATLKSAADGQSGNPEPHDSRLDILSQTLDNLNASSLAAVATKTAPAAVKTTNDIPAVADGATYTVTYTPSYEKSHALAKAADFDERLLMLENALGISSSALPEANHDGLPRAILPTLDSMNKQISTLAQASTANLDAISRRVRSLASDQDRLNDSREKAKNLRDEMGKNGPTSPRDETDQEAKINALYGILPAIEGLTPLLPPLLDRLRSLRALHADAATASQTLDRIETQQLEMAGDLKQWRDGLKKLESSMQSRDTTVEGNMKIMEGWIKGLEERITNGSRGEGRRVRTNCVAATKVWQHFSTLQKHTACVTSTLYWCSLDKLTRVRLPRQQYQHIGTAMTPVSPTANGHFKILYFAGASSFTGKEGERLPAPLSLNKLFTELEAKYPGIGEAVLESCLVTINLEYVDVPSEHDTDGTVIKEADEVAIIPPVSSG